MSKKNEEEIYKVNDYNSTKMFVENFLKNHPDLFNKHPIYINFDKRPVKLLVTLAVVDQTSVSDIKDMLFHYEHNLDVDFYNGMIREYLNSRFDVEIKNSKPLVKHENLVGIEVAYVVLDKETKTKYLVLYTYDSWESDEIEVFYGKDVVNTQAGEPVNV